MEWFYILNLVFAFVSYYLAQQYLQYSAGWWLNMFASAINAAAIANHFL